MKSVGSGEDMYLDVLKVGVGTKTRLQIATKSKMLCNH